MLKPVQKTARRREDVHISTAWTSDLIVLISILLGKGNVEVSADVLDIERSVPFGKPVVIEALLWNIGRD